MKYRKLHIAVKGLLIFGLAVALIILCYTVEKAYAGYVELRTGGGLPAKYVVNGIDVSGKSISDARSIIKDMLGCRQVELCGAKVNISEFTDVDAEFAPEDISIWSYILDEGSLDAAVKYKVDKERLKKVVKSIGCTETKNAEVRFVNGKAVIIPEVYGNVLKVTDKVMEKLKKAISNGKDPELEQFYKQPEITSADLKKDLKKASEWDDYELEVTTDGAHIDTFQINRHLSWNGKKVVVSQKWVEEKISGLASELDTYGKTRVFTTNSGENIEVPGGTMGWLLNKEETEAAVYEAVKNKQKSIELVWDNKSAVMWDPGIGNDIGDTYVEVSISQQKVWYYKDGEVKLETSTVTGLPTPERQTKIGVHHILYKQRDTVLRGASGAWNSFVNYWMPFTLDGQGLHDANWRRKFGGSIYKSSGSHGCVNLPVSFAPLLYAEVETGTPVIVY